MTQMTGLQKASRAAGALLVAGGLFMSVHAVPSFAAANNGADRPGNATCEFVTAGFWDCTTPDGHEWYCTSDTDLSSCQQVKLQLSGGSTFIHPVGGTIFEPVSVSGPTSHSPRVPIAPLAPVAGFTVAP